MSAAALRIMTPGVMTPPPSRVRSRATLLRVGAVACFLLAAVFIAQAQRHREPLTQAEIDQIRDASWEPKQRLTLYVQFTRSRMVKLEQMRSDPKTKDRARQTHDMLDDLLLLYDELNDNIDTYVDRKDDIRKPLKIVIEADTELQAKLRALKIRQMFLRPRPRSLSSC